MDFPIPMRKRNRLQDYDYSRGGAYFITICSLHKKCIFGAVIGSEIEPRMCLNALGETVDAFIRKISTGAHFLLIFLQQNMCIKQCFY